MLAAKADQMKQAVTKGLSLIDGSTTGHVTEGKLLVNKTPESGKHDC